MTAQQADIISTLGVSTDFCVVQETERRIDFLADYLQTVGKRAYVLGVSGGVDSLAAGMLAQTSVERLRTNGYAAQLVAVRLPYGKQIDEEDALLALATIKPDRAVTINIKPVTDALLCETRNQAGDLFDTAKEDFHCGNIKARQRMVVQYALAASIDGLVIGTSHAAEALMGSFTKFGNNAADIFPLSNLNKRQIKAIASYLYAPISLVLKPPTGTLNPAPPYGRMKKYLA